MSVPTEMSKYLGSARKISEIWGSMIYNVKDSQFAGGAKADGSDDTNEVNAAYNAVYAAGGGIVDFPFGNYYTPGTLVAENNNIGPLSVYARKGSMFNFLEGSKASPNSTDKDPLVWVQKFTKSDTDGDAFAQHIGGGFFEVYAKGTGVAGTNNNENTWMALCGNAVQAGVNYGTSTVQDWDASGSVIGVTGFARAEGYPGTSQVITALWGYASTPNLDDTTFNNLPAGENFATIGTEINIDIRHKDPGQRDIVAGHGSSVGQYLFNYRTPGRGVRDWTFGLALNGNPDDNNYAGTNVDLWNGFWTGILVDKIKGAGIKFGQYFKSGSYGIKFPDSYSGLQEPAAGIYMGNNKINIGKYTGVTYAERDFWAYDGAATADKSNLVYRRNGISEFMFGSRGVSASTSITQSHRMIIRIAGKEYAIPLQYLNDV